MGRYGCFNNRIMAGPVCMTLVAGCSFHAAAEPVRFVHRGVASGTLIGDGGPASRINFGPAEFVIDATGDIGDRADLISGPGGERSGFEIRHLSATVSIGGLGSFDLRVPTRTYVVHRPGEARVGFGMAGGFAPPDLYNGPLLAGLADWDMTTSISGQAPGGGLVFQWDAAEVLTDGGLLRLDFRSAVNWGFEAAVAPGPPVVACMVFGALAAARRRR
ncbi:MAG: hypothetical protein AAGA55_07545 [Planctomycetota bacterium]